MGYLEYFLYIRGAVIWENRNLPSYLGPTTWQLFHLLALFLANSAVLIALSILLFRSLWMLGSNETTIEGWEIERHDTLVRRARVFGGCLDGPDGTKIKIVKQEFPYDIGIWNNIRAGMGGSNNFISWFWPFARTAKRDTGLEFETNGFEDDSVSWPPPDPDRMHRYVPRGLGENEMLLSDNGNYDAEEIHAFRQRQQNDYLRVSGDQTEHRTKTFHKRFTDILDGTDSDSGEEGWRNSEGDRLRDFGVDEEIEFYDEDDVPLATLIQRRKGRAKDK
ncbi:Palmitoyltransferase [Myotisia sp. PD_48]|nr:Palmitoyltransferase [Myotisia sp. PD_48]